MEEKVLEGMFEFVKKYNSHFMTDTYTQIPDSQKKPFTLERELCQEIIQQHYLCYPDVEITISRIMWNTLHYLWDELTGEVMDYIRLSTRFNLDEEIVVLSLARQEMAMAWKKRDRFADLIKLIHSFELTYEVQQIFYNSFEAIERLSENSTPIPTQFYLR